MENQLKRKKSAIYSSLLKYGYSNFRLEILEYCKSAADVIQREQYFIDLLEPEYNLNKTAGSSFGNKHSEETKERMSASKKGENNPLFGKNHTDETLSRMSKAKAGTNNPMFGKNLSEETRAKISKKLGFTVEVTDTSTNDITVYDTIGKAAISLAASYTTLSRYIENQKLYRGRYLVVIKPK
jgi:group I intron endonuclease